MNYCVNLWGSDPDQQNDDCWTGIDCDSEEEAVEAFENWEETFSQIALRSATFVQLIGPSGERKKRIAPDPEPSKDDDWVRERAMQAGMAFGTCGYNDVYGY